MEKGVRVPLIGDVRVGGKGEREGGNGISLCGDRGCCILRGCDGNEELARAQ